MAQKRRREQAFKGDSTEMSDRYLAVLEARGPQTKVTELCRAAGCSRNAVYTWRKFLPTFREREDAIKKDWQDGKRSAPPPPSDALDIEGLDELEAKWIHLYRETKERALACESLGVTWAFMEARIKSNDKLRKQFEAIFNGLVVASEDSLMRRGANGDVGAAKEVLKAHVPKYRNKLEVDQHTTLDVQLRGDEVVRELGGWIKRFGRLQPAGEYRRDRMLEDVIEAEAVVVS